MKSRGVIAAGDALTADAGARVLRAGGNATDAVVAAAFASFVTEPPLSAAAGAGVAICGDVDSGFEVFDFFTAVPGATLPAEALDFRCVTIDFGATTQEFHVGRGSTAVPTVLPGLVELHARRGRAPLAEVLAPAIGLARAGCTLSAPIRWVVELLRPIVTYTPEVFALYSTADGRLAPEGGVLANPCLADFLEQLGREGNKLVRGEFADRFAHEFGPANGGLLLAGDIRDYRPVRRVPLRVDFCGRSLLTNPAPSSGGLLIAVGLQLAERADLGAHAFGSVGHMLAVARVLEAMSRVHRTAVADHNVDAELVARALDDDLLNETFADAEERHLGGTTHISVLDRDGGAASLTLTNGEGCGHALAGFGIHANNFLGEDDINPGGFHALAPGTRMTTMMAPSIVIRDGRPELVLGSGGSNRIRSAILQVLLYCYHHDIALDAAVAAPRQHVEGRRLWFERAGLSPNAETALRRLYPDHSAFPTTSMFFGGVHAVGIDSAFGDDRRGGAVRIVR